jgi:hypothetical protein
LILRNGAPRGSNGKSGDQPGADGGIYPEDSPQNQRRRALGHQQQTFVGGAARFLHKGTNGRWKYVVSSADLARYDAQVEALFTPDLAHWVANGWGKR